MTVSSPDPFERCWMDSLSPTWFFAGVAIAFLGCCLLGFACTFSSGIDDFHRFHRFINHLALYYPTANQMVNTIKRSCNDNQVVVVVGGNSILFGHGEPIEHIWTDSLKSRLGKQYCVVNYAFEGTFPFEGGYWAAEALTRQGYKVIFITDAEPDEVYAAPGYSLRSMFFNFRNRGLLIDYPPRNRQVDQLLKEESSKHQYDYAESDLAGKVDASINASDLWNWISYNFIGTIWTESTPFVVLPRRCYKDIEDIALPPTDKWLKEKAAEIVLADSPLATKDRAGNWVEVPQSWNRADELIEQTLPPVMRKRSIILTTRYSPLVTNCMSAEEKKRNDAVYDIAVDHWKAAGCSALVIGSDYTELDYVDGNHFSQFADAKLVDSVEREVRALSRRLGYE